MRVLNFPSPYAQGERPYDIFKNRMAAVNSIAGGIKDIITNKYINKQLSKIAENFPNKVSEQQATDLTNIITSPPPKEIYPANLEDTVGQIYDKIAMSPMRQKETMMGNLPAVGGTTPTTPTTEAMIPKTTLSQIYSAVKNLPTRDINWDNIYKKITENKPFWMGTTEAEQFVLNQMAGQASSDPRDKIASDINLSKLVKGAFYPEPEKPTEYDKKLDLFLQANPTAEEVKKFVGGYIAPEKKSDFDKRLAAFMLTKPTVPEMKKFLGGYISETKPVDIKTIFENVPEGYELSSYNISSTGQPSFSFRRKGSDYGFKTWDEAQEFLRTHPQEGFVGKIETEKGGYNVKWYKETDEGGLKPITASDIKTFETMIYGDEESPGIITPENYAKVKDYIARTGKNFPVPEYLEIAEKNLSKCLDTNNSVLDMDLYKFFYKYYKDALKGESPKYLPPELIEKVGFFKNKYGSALADDYELDFEAMKKDGVTEKDIQKELGGISP